jgi:hypothetical protein
MSTLSHSLTALTALTPTPCMPALTPYDCLLNLPPACSRVRASSAALMPNSALMPVGMPRPLSLTRTEPSEKTVTSMWVQYPARYSSMELSTTSQTRWCSAEPSWTLPMYIPGSLRTASRPSSTPMLSAP